MPKRQSVNNSIYRIRCYWADNLKFPTASYYDSADFMETLGACFACGMEYGDGYLEKAHIYPVCKGGSNDLSNIHALCKTCHKNSEFLYGDAYWDWFNTRTFEDVKMFLAAKSGVNLFQLFQYRTKP